MEYIDYNNLFGKMLGGEFNKVFEQIFSGATIPKSPYESLGNGYELRPIEILAEGGQFVMENKLKYSHLYHNGLKVSDNIFRKGGSCIGFKDGYASLILYTQIKDHDYEKNQLGFNSGDHVIVNHLGEIALTNKGQGLDYPSHIGGNVGKLSGTFYNLLTREPIISPNTSNSIKGEKYIIIEHKYSWYDKEKELGIYMIDKQTCELTLIDKQA